MEKIQITDQYITLGQLLKITNLFDSGGFIKNYLRDEGVYVNQKLEHRRGRKLYPNDIIQIGEAHTFIVYAQE
jgi:S4 domain protein YaaA